MTVESFTSLVLKLAARVKQLHHEANDLSLREFEKQVGTCIAFLQLLYERAQEESIDLLPFGPLLTDIGGALGHLESILDRRKLPRWKKALYQVGGLLNAIMTLFSIGPIFPSGPGPAGLLSDGNGGS